MLYNRVSTICIMIMGYNILQLCSCAGSFEIRLVSLTVGSKREFRPELRICLKHFERRISHNGECTFGEVTIDSERLRNGTKIEFQFSWPESFTLITEAWRTTGSLKELIFHDGFQREGIPAGKQWKKETLVGMNGFRMEITYRITCANDYYGPRCIMFCQPMSTTIGHFECTENGTLACSDGWEGASCDIARCDGCVNGVCDRPGSCRCRTGWSGPNCDQCIRYPGCKHGTCKQPNQCICDEGWGGHFCNEDLNYCTRHRPCKNGATCRNTGHGQYTCECSDGYVGTNCETRVQNCSLQPCPNGASCTDKPGNNYTCICPRGYSGRHCQVSARSCKDRPCQNGAVCMELREGAFICKCSPGWTGTTCDIETGPCAGIQCFNGGKCVESNGAGSYDCICPLGFTGKHCEENANECTQFNPCKNGGRCIDEVNNYKCQCPDGFSGTLCEDSIACIHEPCMNGGQCINVQDDGYYCKCRRGFKGMNCEIAEIGCDRSPCRNGGTCFDSPQGFRCLCPPCFYGDNCLHLEPQCHSVQRHNRTGAFVVKIENEQQASNDGLNFRDLLLILLSSCCILALLLFAVVLYRLKVAKRRTSSIDASLQNDLNSRRLSKYSEQKPCLSVCTGQNAELNYCQRERIIKPQTMSTKKRLSSPRSSDNNDYGVRYAVEPTVNLKLPSMQCTNSMCFKADSQHSRKQFDVVHLPLPVPPLQDGDNYYEEIDDDDDDDDFNNDKSLSKVVIQQEDSISNLDAVNSRTVPDVIPRRWPRNVDQEVTDIQTNL